MKTVIHFVDGDAVGGTERVAIQLMTAFDRQQWRPVLFHHGGAGLAPMLAEATAAGIETRVVPRLHTIHHAARLPAFVQAIRAERPCVMHAHLSWPLSCKYGLLAAALASVPAVAATAHLYFDVSATPVVAMQPRFIARTVGRYLAVSERVARQLKDEFSGQLSRRLASPNERLELGARARAYVAAHHSWSAYADRLDAIYRELGVR